MSNRTCSVPDCDRAYRSGGYCGLHYDRLRRSGTTDAPIRVERICSVEGCDRKHLAGGYCNAHYKRTLEHGDPLAEVPLQRKPTADERPDIVGRILAQCVSNEESGCIEWTGAQVGDSGYGTIGWQARKWVVHRAMWTATVGPIPTDDDWTLDHLCRNRVCVNVDHLEVVTRTENSLRAGGLAIAWAKNAAVGQCINGHDYSPENTRWTKGGQRRCRECRRQAWAKRRDAENAARRAAYAERRAAGLGWEEARLGGVSHEARHEREGE